MLSLVRNQGIDPLEAESQMFHTTHGEVGAYLLGLWGLPDNVVESTAFHHKPTEASAEGFHTLTAVHVADALAHEFDPESDVIPCPQLDEPYLTQVGLAHRIADWRDACRDVFEREMDHEREDLVRR